MRNEQKKKSSVQSVERALSIIEVLARAGRGVTLKELSEQIGLAPSTTYRLLDVLCFRDYVWKDSQTKEYSLGIKILEISGDLHIASILRAKGGRFTRALADTVGETINVAILDRLECVVVDRVESRHTLRCAVPFGTRALLHCTGTGKVLLAHLPESDIEAVMQKGLPALTSKTITNRGLLQKELEQVRREGYAIDNEEHELGVRCVAAPIRDRSGAVIASVSISGPAGRVTLQSVQDLVCHIKETAAAISRALGYEDVPVSEPIRDEHSCADNTAFSSPKAHAWPDTT